MNIFNRIGKSFPGRLGNNKGFIASAIAAISSALVGIGTAVGVGGAGLAAGLTGAALVGTAAVGVGSLLTGGGAGGTPDFQAPPVQSAANIIAQSEQAAEEKRKDTIRAKRRKTVLTGPTGIFEEAETAQKTLLGA